MRKSFMSATIRADYRRGVFKATVTLHIDYYVSTRSYEGTLKECRRFIEDVCRKEIEDEEDNVRS